MSAEPPWTCDACGHPILQIEDGWVEWLNRHVADGESESHSLRLVHRFGASPHGENRCMHNEKAAYAEDRSTVADLDLSEFLGADGLMRLLEFASDRKFELDDLIEFIKRLHIPGYDQARHSFRSAIADGAFEPGSKAGFYLQRDIQATLRWKRNQQ